MQRPKDEKTTDSTYPSCDHKLRRSTYLASQALKTWENSYHKSPIFHQGPHLKTELPIQEPIFEVHKCVPEILKSADAFPHNYTQDCRSHSFPTSHVFFYFI
eukprot:TRINITY_DN19484_c0_g1_i1.p1 TRINITY_DN19484_c0_g1~~TRINITY_DN19484_c0_g1_i1.p1  ORF type:complete len:102 (-),score=6.86 TRINITY_DN19484_c0_g1_i1:228-533(-)